MPDTHPKNIYPSPKPPTKLARRLVNYILGFGVGIAIGLAPYLGSINLPFFKAILSLYPESLQNSLIPLSAALMGIIAVIMQWYGGDKLTRRWLKKTFGRTLTILILSFIALLIIYTIVVVNVPILGGKDSVAFVVGFNRPLTPPCTADVSDSECIKRITLDTSEIESFWGDRQVRGAKLLLTLSYLLFTGAFGTLVGIVLLRDEFFDKATKKT